MVFSAFEILANQAAAAGPHKDLFIGLFISKAERVTGKINYKVTVSIHPPRDDCTSSEGLRSYMKIRNISII